MGSKIEWTDETSAAEVEHGPVSRQPRRYQVQRIERHAQQPRPGVSVLLTAVAGAARRDHVAPLGDAAASHREYMIKSRGGPATSVGTQTVGGLEEHLASFQANPTHSPTARGRVARPIATGGAVGLAVNLVAVHSTHSCAHISGRAPSFAASTPRVSIRQRCAPFRDRRSGGSSDERSSATTGPPVTSRRIDSESFALMPIATDPTPLLTAGNSRLVLLNCQPDARRSDLDRSSRGSHTPSIARPTDIRTA